MRSLFRMIPNNNPDMTDNPKETIRHEETDTHARPLWLTAAGLVLFCILTMLAMVSMFNGLQRRIQHAEQNAGARDVIPSITASQHGFPEPRLQVNPSIDLAALRAREESELNSYGWVDKNAGVLRIPIERAMDLTVERGLPVQGQPGAPLPTRTTLDMQQARPLERETITPLRTK